MVSGSSRAYKLQLSDEGVALFLRCHDRMCRAVGDLLPYGSTLLVAVTLLHRGTAEEAASVLLEASLDRLGGKKIRYVGTSCALSDLIEELAQKIFQTGSMATRPQVWKLFLAAIFFMQEATDAEIVRCYRSAGLTMRMDRSER
ncbi:MAG: hypothetical protein KGJ57_08205 [Sphingomonadales bacterium]|nr:hypothetical protein [Sphingomonadales bacterium]MDE2169396.1 hypothetical protein [Sphingomonadales bacterium]